MYLPGMFFGSSSFIHLLASNPRVVALFGVGALVATSLHTPFATADVIGTANYVERLEQAARNQGTIDEQTIVDARRSAASLTRLSEPRRTEIVAATLRSCGQTCFGLKISTVMNDRALLEDVLFLHTLLEVRQRRAAGTSPAGGSNTAIRH